MKIIDSFDGKYEFLSNFFVGLPIEIDGESYKTTEHWYQASKAQTYDIHDMIRAADTPGAAKKLGRQLDSQKKTWPDWHEHPTSSSKPPRKQRVMWKGLTRKFVPDSKMARMLMDTDDALLIEGNWWGDDYWGTVNGKGFNVLGRMLMRWRSYLLDNTARQGRTLRTIKFTERNYVP